MVSFTQTFILLSLLLTALATFGGEGTGTRGGENVDENGRKAFRDLVDKSNCRWVKGHTFEADLPYFSKVQESLDHVHWYLGDVLKRDARNLAVCKTEAPLMKVSAEDQEKMTIYEVSGRQVAIRIGNDIIVSMPEFRSLQNPRYQAYAWLHEKLHTLMAFDTPKRNHKLRSFVAACAENELTPMTQDDFNLQIEKNSIQIVSISKPLEDHKDVFQTALAHAEDEEGWLNAYYLKTRFQMFNFTLKDQDLLNSIAWRLIGDTFDRVRSGTPENNLKVLQRIDQGFNPNETIYTDPDSITLLGAAIETNPTLALELLKLPTTRVNGYHRLNWKSIYDDSGCKIKFVNLAYHMNSVVFAAVVSRPDFDAKAELAEPTSFGPNTPLCKMDPVLHNAAFNGSSNTLRTLLSLPQADVNEVWKQVTPLVAAIANANSTAAVLALLQRSDIDVNKTANGFGDRHTFFGMWDFYSFVDQAGSEHSEDGRPLWHAIYWGANPEIVKLLLARPEVDLSPTLHHDGGTYFRSAPKKIKLSKLAEMRGHPEIAVLVRVAEESRKNKK